MTSASNVVQVSEKSFVAGLGPHVGGTEVARAIYTHATNVAIRNNMALTSLLQTARGTVVAMIDGATSKAERISEAIQAAAQQPEQVVENEAFSLHSS